jgi:CBS domain-containing protein
MTAKELMTPNPACCTMDTSLTEIARLMVRHDCGEIPVIERQDVKRVVGVVTDRDIVARGVASGTDCAATTAGDVMTTPAVTVPQNSSVEDVVRTMEQHRIRRVPVVDGNGACCGMIAQADVARSGSRKDTGQLVREVSTPR